MPFLTALLLALSVTPPVPISRAEPQYTELARDAAFEGVVAVQVIVDQAGEVRDPKIAKRVGMGLDEEAQATALQWKFRPATKDGEPASVFAQIEVTFRNTASHDVAWMRAAARTDDAAQHLRLGKAYYWGRDVTQDYAAALLWFRKAAAKDNARSESYLGMMYAQGQGVAQDSAEAARWFQKAAEQNDVVAEFYLGKALMAGDGVSINLTQAYQWLSLAASQPGQKAQATALLNELRPKMTPSELDAGKVLTANFKARPAAP